MKKFSFTIFCAVVFGIAIYAATPMDNIPISQMPITTNVQEQAYFPLIQKYPGRSTNDNFRATISTLFHGRAGETVTNLAVTNIYVSNIFATTIYTTNLFYTNINGADPLWTNIANVLQPTAGTSVLVSNLSSAESLTALNSFFMPTSLTSNMVAGENDLSVYQVGSMLLQGSSTNPDDTVVNLNSGGTGQFLFIENGPTSGFTIFDGQPLWDASGLIILTPGLGDWRPTQRGETMFLKKSQNQNWQEVARFGGNTNSFGESLWHTNVGGASISPNLAGTKLYVTPKGYIGMGTTNIFDGKDIGIFRNVADDGGASVFINTGMADVWPSPTWYSEWWSKLAPNEAVMDMTSSGSGGTFDHVWTVSHNNPSGFFYYQMRSNSVPTLELAGEAGTITLRDQINFGFDLTNSLYRNGKHLVWTNTDPTGNFVSFKIGTPAGEAAFSVSGNTAVVQGLNSVDLYDSVNTLRWFSKIFLPFQTNVVLGGVGTSVNQAFADLQLDRAYYQYGFYDTTATNYTRLKVSHSGPSGATIYDSQAGGIAGDPRPHRFDLGSTNQFNIGDGWVQLANGITKAQKSTIAATNGMMVYQTDNTPGLRAYVNGAWVIISTAADP